jgi:hypothetical protein
VLEHIPDDRMAIREMHRVLSDEGWALIMVPLTATTTVESPLAHTAAERERMFGQMDHVRRYGPDVVGRLEQAGFRVTQYTTDNLVEKPEIDRLGLSPRDVIYFCAKAPKMTPD